MDCPVCAEKLKEIERSGVLVDICPSCKGVWLDRGEIDKLLEAESGAARVIPLARERDNRRDEEKRDDHDHDHDREHRDEGYGSDRGSSKKSKRSSLLGDILGGFGGD
jgi:Zn-finger nucleic acid-binding protein